MSESRVGVWLVIIILFHSSILLVSGATPPPPPTTAPPTPPAGIQEFADYVWTAASNIICFLYFVFILIAGALAALIIVYNGVRWIASGDDAGARKNAKEAILHTIIALIIILLANEIVSLVYSGPQC
ncbi:MAG: hypothetical protein ABH851_02380 [Methanobacteriota archaeon]